MKKIILSLATLLAATAFAPQASAVPAFARQTGKACTTCHFQSFPALNDYGQEFKASGYTEVGKQGVVKGDDLSVPAVMNASLFVKARYQKTNGTDGTKNGAAAKTTHSGEIQFPDEFALLIGGRVTENIGFLVESQFAGGDKTGKNFLAGFKLPMMFAVGESGMKAGVVPFLTDGLGAGYGFELLNTGAVRNIRINEHRSETSAHQYVFNHGELGAASGMAFVMHNPQFHVAYTKFTPHHMSVAGSDVGNLDAGLLRAVWTPTLGDFAMGVGLQSYTGTNVRIVAAATPTEHKDTKGTALDVQAQGVVGEMPVGVYLTYAVAPAGTATVANLYNDSTTGDRKATVIMTELGIVPNKVMVQFAYRMADNGAATANNANAWTVGGKYHMAQNVQLSLSHSKSTGDATYGDSKNPGAVAGNSLTTLMLASGF